MILLSILIPTTPDRSRFIDDLHMQFCGQLQCTGSKQLAAYGGSIQTTYYQYQLGDAPIFAEVEVIECIDNYEYTVGQKRNWLLEFADGKNVAFVDSDDTLSDTYFKNIFEGIRKDVDCCSMKGIIYEKNSPPRYFEHSLRYKKYKTTAPDPTGFSDRLYERFPNHLNCIRASIAKQFKFPNQNVSEDTDWATQIHNSGLLKTEHYIDEPIYFYTPSDTRK